MMKKMLVKLTPLFIIVTILFSNFNVFATEEVSLKNEITEVENIVTEKNTIENESDTISRNNDSAIDFEEEGCSENNDTSGVAVSINRIVGSILTIIQIFCSILFFICLLKVVKFFRKKDFRKARIYALVSIAPLFIYNLLNIVKNFAVKPIIYIYPEKEEEVNIKLSNPEKLTCSYPKYVNGWNVLAKTNGDLIDLESKRNLYALYWEGLNTTKNKFEEGFIVEGENVSKFLEEKLEILGLNEREAEEFIVYWLPLMEKNKYNYIRFETMDEIEENMNLEITPKPETLIRINMEFKPLSKPLNIKEQKLEKVERKGYTVVEWGGTRI